MRFLVMTSDKYIAALRPFAYLFNKYWGRDVPQVVVGGFTPPDFELPSNFTFVSIGNFNDYPFGKWSNALAEVIIKHMPDDVFGLMLEDYWIVREVDAEAVRILYEYMRQFEYVLKIDLCADRLYAKDMQPYGHCNRLDLVKSDYNSPYHMSLMTGLWRRDLLLTKVLIANESPHDVEIAGTDRLRRQRENVLVLGTRQWPLRHTLALRARDPNSLMLDELQPHDVAELRRLGYLKPWGMGDE